MFTVNPFAFIPLRRADFPLLSAWLGTPHVSRWWADDPSLEAIEATYGGNVDGAEPSQVFIVHRNDEPIGLTQRYRIAAYPAHRGELEKLVAISAEVSSIDYLIGPPRALGQGWGVAMIRSFALELWCDDLDCTAIVVPVHAANRASWRTLERAGFLRVACGSLTPDNPADDTHHYIYRQDRPAPR